MAAAEQLITEYLAIWSSAIQAKSAAGRGKSNKLELYGVKKLRELILELAVRGLLVPQDANDEPASELLKKISAEKAKLVKDGKIKKPKALPAIEEGETPFELPVGWCWARLRDIGHDWGQKQPDKEFTYIDVGSINKEFGLIEEPSILQADEAPSRARKIIKNGTVIYSTVRPYLLNIAVIDRDFEPEPIASTAFAIIHPFRGISASYIYRYLRSPVFVQYVENVQTGIAYPAINDKQFFSGVIPAPPTSEQARIVAKVDELMALCDQLEQQQESSITAHQALVQTLLDALTTASERDVFTTAWARIADYFDTLFSTEWSIDQLKQTILQLAVMGKLVPQDPNDEPASELLAKTIDEKKQLIKEKAIRNTKAPSLPNELPNAELPDKWVWTNLNEIGEIGPRNDADDKVEASFVPMQLISEKYGSPAEHEVKQWKDIKSGFTHFKEEDVVLAKITPCFQNAKSAVMRGLTNGFGAGTTELHVYRAINSVTVPEYVLIYLKSPGFIMNGIPKMTGTAGQKRVTRDYFAGNHFPLPPLSEQYRIVAKVDELMALCDTLKNRIQAAQAAQVHLADAVVVQAVV